jgi:hypothetical protein
MKKLTLAAVTLCFALSNAFAQNAATCESKAIDKNGKALAGAAKNSFMKKCEAENKDPKIAACETKAVGKNGKALAGAAKTSFMKKCQAEA